MARRMYFVCKSQLICGFWQNQDFNMDNNMNIDCLSFALVLIDRGQLLAKYIMNAYLVTIKNGIIEEKSIWMGGRSSFLATMPTA